MEWFMAAASITDWFDINNAFTRYATSLDRGDVSMDRPFTERDF
jgi:hypothetical protein